MKSLFIALADVMAVTVIFAGSIYCSGWHVHRCPELSFLFLYWLAVAVVVVGLHASWRGIYHEP
jgi:hypothetical protein